MKKNNIILLGVLFCLFGYSCSDDWNKDLLTGNGVLALQVKLNEQITVGTRSLSLEEQQTLEASCQIKIYSNQGLIRYYNGLSALPDTLHLVAGSYRVAVVAGDSLASSFSTKYYKGEKEITISKGSYQQENVNCKIQNVVASVKLTEELAQLIEEDYSIKLYTAAGNDTLLFTKENIDVMGYFMPAEGVTQLGWSFTAKMKQTNERYMQDGVIENIERTTHYALTFNTLEDEVNDGAAWVELSVDRTPIEIENEINIYQPPVIWGDRFDINSILRYGAVSKDSLTIWIATSSNLELATVACSSFPTWGVTNTEVNLVSHISDEYILTSRTYSPNGKTNYTQLTLLPRLVEQMSAEDGNYTFIIKAKGVEDELVAQVTLQITVSSLPFVINNINEADVYTNRATITGTVVTALGEMPNFRYRIKGENDWNVIAATLNEQLLAAELTNLISGTTYQYQLYLDEEHTSIIEEFTTEARLQLPNNGFEEYHQANNNAYLFYPSGGSLWWDSGNHGSITMSKNVTSPDTEVYNESGLGTTSLKLKSQFVGVLSIGKFAAGNLFAGKYLKTDGTDGILGFGRAWNSRPKTLVGYVRYNSGIVDYASSYLEKGAQDIGSIYIALGDWTPVEEEGELWPVVIKTKTAQLFDPNPNTNDGLIAYGEINYNYTTDGMIRFEIPIEYFKNRKPTAIVLVASASKYGDYFSGSTSSTMWIDDFELIYE